MVILVPGQPIGAEGFHTCPSDDALKHQWYLPGLLEASLLLHGRRESGLFPEKVK
jgi:hypothetical protein